MWFFFKGSRWNSGESQDFGVSKSDRLKPDLAVPRSMTMGKLLLPSEALVLICEMGIRITFQF